VILPPDDSIVLPASDDGNIVIDKTNPTVSLAAGSTVTTSTLADLLSLLPGAFRGGSSAIRDTLLQTWGEMANAMWARASFVLEAQQSPRFADTSWLDVWGDIFKKARLAAEDDPTYRARLLAPVDVVTPNAIKPAVIAIAQQYTQLAPVFFETVDAAFCGPATTSDAVVKNSNNDSSSSTYGTQPQHGVLPPWQTWTQPQLGASTTNQTVVASRSRRLLANYPDKASNPPVYTVPAVGAIFFIVLQSDSNDDSQMPFCNTVAAVTDYCAPATTSDPVVTHSNNDPTDPTYGTQPSHGVVPTWSPGFCGPVGNTLMEQIRNEVEQRKAGGVSWFAFVDPLLNGAV